MSELNAGAVTAFFDRVASDWDEMRLVYYDEAVIEHLLERRAATRRHRRLPLAGDSVDAAVANMVLHHAADPAAMLREMARIVRPGGAVAICDEARVPK